MNKQQLHLITILGAAVAISVSSLFVARSLQQSPKKGRAVAAEPPTIDERTMMTREALVADADLADRIRDRISSQGSLSELAPKQIESLTIRTAAILRARASGAFDEYIKLMKSWGGRLNLSEEDLEHLRLGWRPPDAPTSFAKYDVSELSAAVSDTPKTVRMTNGGPGLSALTTPSQFHFQQSWADLGKGNTKQVEIILPTKTNAGSTVELHYVLLWSPAENNWIPFQRTIVMKERRPMPLTIF